MRFGEKIKKESYGKYEDFYMDYAFLKDFIKDTCINYELFLEAVNVEFRKVNAFVQTMQNHETFTKKQLLMYILFNYIGFYKIFKKYDKIRSQNKKFCFFEIISEQGFYKYYKQHTQKFNSNIRLVIFDKDGTLIDNTAMFGSWTVKLLEKLENVFPSLLEEEPGKLSIWDHLGYEKASNMFRADSVIARGNNDDIRNSICDYIINKRKLVICKNISDSQQIINMIRQEWFDIEVSRENIKECGNIRALFEFLKMKNIKIAICTSDDRRPTEETLQYLNIAVADPQHNKCNYKMSYTPMAINRRDPFMIDYLVCGNDMIPIKPSPEPLLTVCQKLKIAPSQSMMVGDTLADVHAGINARFSRTAGVLSGNYLNTNLVDATHVVNSIDDLPELFLSMELPAREFMHGEF